MATSADLIKAVAAATGVPETTVGTYYRNLREAGMVKKTGRGRSAAHLTARDAASVLIAVGGARFDKQPASAIIKEFAFAEGSHVSWAAKELYKLPKFSSDDRNLFVESWEELNSNHQARLRVPELVALRSTRTVLEAIEIILNGIVAGSFIGKIGKNNTVVDSFYAKVEFEAPIPLVSIEIFLRGEGIFWMSRGTYYNLPIDHNRNRRAHFATLKKGSDPDISVTRSFTEKTLISVARTISGLNNSQL